MNQTKESAIGVVSLTPRFTGAVPGPQCAFRRARPIAFATVLFASVAAVPARAEMTHGAFSYSSAQNCVAAGKIPAEICAFADQNSAAEFEEKAPRFPTRAVCEKSFGGCQLGFRGADGWAGRKGGVYFSPRRQGFRLIIKSEHDATVVPTSPGLSFAPRSALRRDASINPRTAREQTGATPPAGAGQAGAFGVPTAEGPRGTIPPRPPVDPNFDCAAVLEPGDKGDPSTGCVLAPANRR